MIFDFQGHKLSKSINQSILLIICIAGQHIVRDSKISELTLLADLLTMYYTIYFFLSLKNNFIEYYNFNRIRKPINNLIVIYILITVQIIFEEYFQINNSNINNFGVILFSLILFIGMIYLLISYVFLGIRLIKSKIETTSNYQIYLGYAYAVLTPIGMIISMLVFSEKRLNNYYFLLIIFEIIPILIVIKIYKNIINTKSYRLQ